MVDNDHPYADYIVRVLNGVAYVNDCQANNVDNAHKAIDSFGSVYLIAGGAKGDLALNGLQDVLGKIRHVYLIGEAADDLAKWFKQNGVENTLSETIDIAVLEAHAAAQLARGEPGGAGTVLLSPILNVDETFRSPEHLGQTFTEIVNNLSVEAPE